jgi:hypothetical protein
MELLSLVWAAASANYNAVFTVKFQALVAEASWRQLELNKVREVPLIHMSSDLELATGHAGSPFMLCLRQFAFPYNALMLFACTFDAIFELAPIVRE